MTRPIDAAMLADLSADMAELVHFVELQFSSGTVRYTTATRDITWNGNTWQAVGGVLTLQPVTESPDLSPTQTQITMSGVDLQSGVIPVLLNEKYMGRAINVWLGHMDRTTFAVTDSPVLAFMGVMNGGFAVKDSRGDVTTPPSCTVTLRAMSRIALLKQARGIAMNVASHSFYFPGDKFFEFVPTIAAIKLTWGQPSGA